MLEGEFRGHQSSGLLDATESDNRSYVLEALHKNRKSVTNSHGQNGIFVQVRILHKN